MQGINDSGKSWISNYPIRGVPSIRTCISNYSSSAENIDNLIEGLNNERKKYKSRRENSISTKDKIRRINKTRKIRLRV